MKSRRSESNKIVAAVLRDAPISSQGQEYHTSAFQRILGELEGSFLGKSDAVILDSDGFHAEYLALGSQIAQMEQHRAAGLSDHLPKPRLAKFEAIKAKFLGLAGKHFQQEETQLNQELGTLSLVIHRECRGVSADDLPDRIREWKEGVRALKDRFVLLKRYVDDALSKGASHHSLSFSITRSINSAGELNHFLDHIPTPDAGRTEAVAGFEQTLGYLAGTTKGALSKDLGEFKADITANRAVLTRKDSGGRGDAVFRRDVGDFQAICEFGSTASIHYDRMKTKGLDLSASPADFSTLPDMQTDSLSRISHDLPVIKYLPTAGDVPTTWTEDVFESAVKQYLEIATNIIEGGKQVPAKIYEGVKYFQAWLKDDSRKMDQAALTAAFLAIAAYTVVRLWSSANVLLGALWMLGIPVPNGPGMTAVPGPPIGPMDVLSCLLLTYGEFHVRIESALTFQHILMKTYSVSGEEFSISASEREKVNGRHGPAVSTTQYIVDEDEAMEQAMDGGFLAGRWTNYNHEGHFFHRGGTVTAGNVVRSAKWERWQEARDKFIGWIGGHRERVVTNWRDYEDRLQYFLCSAATASEADSKLKIQLTDLDRLSSAQLYDLYSSRDHDAVQAFLTSEITRLAETHRQLADQFDERAARWRADAQYYFRGGKEHAVHKQEVAQNWTAHADRLRQDAAKLETKLSILVGEFEDRENGVITEAQFAVLDPVAKAVLEAKRILIPHASRGYSWAPKIQDRAHLSRALDKLGIVCKEEFLNAWEGSQLGLRLSGLMGDIRERYDWFANAFEHKIIFDTPNKYYWVDPRDMQNWHGQLADRIGQAHSLTHEEMHRIYQVAGNGPLDRRMADYFASFIGSLTDPQIALYNTMSPKFVASLSLRERADREVLLAHDAVGFIKDYTEAVDKLQFTRDNLVWFSGIDHEDRDAVMSFFKSHSDTEMLAIGFVLADAGENVNRDLGAISTLSAGMQDAEARLTAINEQLKQKEAVLGRVGLNGRTRKLAEGEVQGLKAERARILQRIHGTIKSGIEAQMTRYYDAAQGSHFIEAAVFTGHYRQMQQFIRKYDLFPDEKSATLLVGRRSVLIDHFALQAYFKHTNHQLYNEAIAAAYAKLGDGATLSHRNLQYVLALIMNKTNEAGVCLLSRAEEARVHGILHILGQCPAGPSPEVIARLSRKLVGLSAVPVLDISVRDFVAQYRESRSKWTMSPVVNTDAKDRLMAAKLKAVLGNAASMAILYDAYQGLVTSIGHEEKKLTEEAFKKKFTDEILKGMPEKLQGELTVSSALNHLILRQLGHRNFEIKNKPDGQNHLYEHMQGTFFEATLNEFTILQFPYDQWKDYCARYFQGNLDDFNASWDTMTDQEWREKFGQLAVMFPQKPKRHERVEVVYNGSIDKDYHFKSINYNTLEYDCSIWSTLLAKRKQNERAGAINATVMQAQQHYATDPGLEKIGEAANNDQKTWYGSLQLIHDSAMYFLQQIEGMKKGSQYDTKALAEGKHLEVLAQCLTLIQNIDQSGDNGGLKLWPAVEAAVADFKAKPANADFALTVPLLKKLLGGVEALSREDRVLLASPKVGTFTEGLASYLLEAGADTRVTTGMATGKGKLNTMFNCGTCRLEMFMQSKLSIQRSLVKGPDDQTHGVVTLRNGQVSYTVRDGDKLQNVNTCYKIRAEDRPRIGHVLQNYFHEMKSSGKTIPYFNAFKGDTFKIVTVDGHGHRIDICHFDPATQRSRLAEGPYHIYIKDNRIVVYSDKDCTKVRKVIWQYHGVSSKLLQYAQLYAGSHAAAAKEFVYTNRNKIDTDDTNSVMEQFIGFFPHDRAADIRKLWTDPHDLGIVVEDFTPEGQIVTDWRPGAKGDRLVTRINHDTVRKEKLHATLGMTNMLKRDIRQILLDSPESLVVRNRTTGASIYSVRRAGAQWSLIDHAVGSAQAPEMELDSIVALLKTKLSEGGDVDFDYGLFKTTAPAFVPRLASMLEDKREKLQRTITLKDTKGKCIQITNSERSGFNLEFSKTFDDTITDGNYKEKLGFLMRNPGCLIEALDETGCLYGSFVFNESGDIVFNSVETNASGEQVLRPEKMVFGFDQFQGKKVTFRVLGAGVGNVAALASDVFGAEGFSLMRSRTRSAIGTVVGKIRELSGSSSIRFHGELYNQKSTRIQAELRITPDGYVLTKIATGEVLLRTHVTDEVVACLDRIFQDVEGDLAVEADVQLTEIQTEYIRANGQREVMSTPIQRMPDEFITEDAASKYFQEEAGYEVEYMPALVAVGVGPECVYSLAKQLNRWALGGMDSFAAVSVAKEPIYAASMRGLHRDSSYKYYQHADSDNAFYWVPFGYSVAALSDSAARPLVSEAWFPPLVLGYLLLTIASYYRDMKYQGLTFNEVLEKDMLMRLMGPGLVDAFHAHIKHLRSDFAITPTGLGRMTIPKYYMDELNEKMLLSAGATVLSIAMYATTGVPAASVMEGLGQATILFWPIFNAMMLGVGIDRFIGWDNYLSDFQEGRALENQVNSQDRRLLLASAGLNPLQNIESALDSLTGNAQKRSLNMFKDENILVDRKSKMSQINDIHMIHMADKLMGLLQKNPTGAEFSRIVLALMRITTQMGHQSLAIALFEALTTKKVSPKVMEAVNRDVFGNNDQVKRCVFTRPAFDKMIRLLTGAVHDESRVGVVAVDDVAVALGSKEAARRLMADHGFQSLLVPASISETEFKFAPDVVEPARFMTRYTPFILDETARQVDAMMAALPVDIQRQVAAESRAYRSAAPGDRLNAARLLITKLQSDEIISQITGRNVSEKTKSDALRLLVQMDLDSHTYSAVRAILNVTYLTQSHKAAIRSALDASALSEKGKADFEAKLYGEGLITVSKNENVILFRHLDSRPANATDADRTIMGLLATLPPHIRLQLQDEEDGYLASEDKVDSAGAFIDKLKSQEIFSQLVELQITPPVQEAALKLLRDKNINPITQAGIRACLQPLPLTMDALVRIHTLLAGLQDASIRIEFMSILCKSKVTGTLDSLKALQTAATSDFNMMMLYQQSQVEPSFVRESRQYEVDLCYQAARAFEQQSLYADARLAYSRALETLADSLPPSPGARLIELKVNLEEALVRMEDRVYSDTQHAAYLYKRDVVNPLLRASDEPFYTSGNLQVVGHAYNEARQAFRGAYVDNGPETTSSMQVFLAGYQISREHELVHLSPTEILDLIVLMNENGLLNRQHGPGEAAQVVLKPEFVKDKARFCASIRPLRNTLTEDDVDRLWKILTDHANYAPTIDKLFGAKVEGAQRISGKLFSSLPDVDKELLRQRFINLHQHHLANLTFPDEIESFLTCFSDLAMGASEKPEKKAEAMVVLKILLIKDPGSFALSEHHYVDIVSSPKAKACFIALLDGCHLLPGHRVLVERVEGGMFLSKSELATISSYIGAALSEAISSEVLSLPQAYQDYYLLLRVTGTMNLAKYVSCLSEDAGLPVEAIEGIDIYPLPTLAHLSDYTFSHVTEKVAKITYDILAALEAVKGTAFEKMTLPGAKGTLVEGIKEKVSNSYFVVLEPEEIEFLAKVMAAHIERLEMGRESSLDLVDALVHPSPAHLRQAKEDYFREVDGRIAAALGELTDLDEEGPEAVSLRMLTLRKIGQLSALRGGDASGITQANLAGLHHFSEYRLPDSTLAHKLLSSGVDGTPASHELVPLIEKGRVLALSDLISGMNSDPKIAKQTEDRKSYHLYNKAAMLYARYKTNPDKYRQDLLKSIQTLMAVKEKTPQMDMLFIKLREDLGTIVSEHQFAQEKVGALSSALGLDIPKLALRLIERNRDGEEIDVSAEVNNGIIAAVAEVLPALNIDSALRLLRNTALKVTTVSERHEKLALLRAHGDDFRSPEVRALKDRLISIGRALGVDVAGLFKQHALTSDDIQALFSNKLEALIGPWMKTMPLVQDQGSADQIIYRMATRSFTASLAGVDLRPLSIKWPYHLESLSVAERSERHMVYEAAFPTIRDSSGAGRSNPEMKRKLDEAQAALIHLYQVCPQETLPQLELALSPLTCDTWGKIARLGAPPVAHEIEHAVQETLRPYTDLLERIMMSQGVAVRSDGPTKVMTPVAKKLEKEWQELYILASGASAATADTSGDVVSTLSDGDDTTFKAIFLNSAYSTAPDGSHFFQSLWGTYSPNRPYRRLAEFIAPVVEAIFERLIANGDLYLAQSTELGDTAEGHLAKQQSDAFFKEARTWLELILPAKNRSNTDRNLLAIKQSKLSSGNPSKSFSSALTVQGFLEIYVGVMSEPEAIAKSSEFIKLLGKLGDWEAILDVRNQVFHTAGEPGSADRADAIASRAVPGLRRIIESDTLKAQISLQQAELVKNPSNVEAAKKLAGLLVDQINEHKALKPAGDGALIARNSEQVLWIWQRLAEVELTLQDGGPLLDAIASDPERVPGYFLRIASYSDVNKRFTARLEALTRILNDTVKKDGLEALCKDLKHVVDEAADFDSRKIYFEALSALATVCDVLAQKTELQEADYLDNKREALTIIYGKEPNDEVPGVHVMNFVLPQRQVETSKRTVLARLEGRIPTAISAKSALVSATTRDQRRTVKESLLSLQYDLVSFIASPFSEDSIEWQLMQPHMVLTDDDVVRFCKVQTMVLDALLQLPSGSKLGNLGRALTAVRGRLAELRARPEFSVETCLTLWTTAARFEAVLSDDAARFSEVLQKTVETLLIDPEFASHKPPLKAAMLELVAIGLAAFQSPRLASPMHAAQLAIALLPDPERTSKVETLPLVIPYTAMLGSIGNLAEIHPLYEMDLRYIIANALTDGSVHEALDYTSRQLCQLVLDLQDAQAHEQWARIGAIRTLHAKFSALLEKQVSKIESFMTDLRIAEHVMTSSKSTASLQLIYRRLGGEDGVPADFFDHPKMAALIFRHNHIGQSFRPGVTDERIADTFAEVMGVWLSDETKEDVLTLLATGQEIRWQHRFDSIDDLCAAARLNEDEDAELIHHFELQMQRQMPDPRINLAAQTLQALFAIEAPGIPVAASLVSSLPTAVANRLFNQNSEGIHMWNPAIMSSRDIQTILDGLPTGVVLSPESRQAIYTAWDRVGAIRMSEYARIVDLYTGLPDAPGRVRKADMEGNLRMIHAWESFVDSAATQWDEFRWGPAVLEAFQSGLVVMGSSKLLTLCGVAGATAMVSFPYIIPAIIGVYMLKKLSDLPAHLLNERRKGMMASYVGRLQPYHDLGV